MKLVVPETVSEKGYKETVQVAESTILVVSKAQSRICNESLLDKTYCIYWIIEFRTFNFICAKGGGGGGGGAIAPNAPPVPTAMDMFTDHLIQYLL
jgi:hypothetical protein